MKKILFTTVYGGPQPYDYIKQYNTNRFFEFRLERHVSFGLRFIKQNLPDIEILEYPTLDAYKDKLREGWDVVGISFMMFETAEALAMVRMAREAGVGQVWGGNYGILTPSVPEHFDRTFLGYAEHELGRELGIEIEEIAHPPLVMLLQWFPKINFTRYCYPVGILFTSRGCRQKCTFCQTPAFAGGKQSPLPLTSIERVVRYYAENHIRELFILDENFGALRRHTADVTAMLSNYPIRWTVMTRTDILRANLDEWCERGFKGAFLGIESLSQVRLDGVNKHTRAEWTKSLVAHLQKRLRRTVCFYIIGHENDTVDSVKNDILELRRMNFDFYQICILTPFPRTQLWRTIEDRYGIFDHEYRKYDANHLLWNHPNITPNQMRELHAWTMKNVFAKDWFMKKSYFFYRSYILDFGFKKSIIYLRNTCTKSKLFAQEMKYFTNPNCSSQN